MNQSVLRIVAAHRPPFVFYNGNRTSFQFTGMLVDLLPTLLGYAHINPKLEYYNILQNEGGRLLPNGSWTGIMGELTAGRADISLFPLTLTGSRPEAVDMTYSFLDGGTTILVPKGTYKPSVLGFLAPFSWKVWCALIAAVLAITMIYHLLTWASPFGNYDSMRLRKTKAHASEVRKYVVESRMPLLLVCWSESPLSEALLSMMGAPCVPQGSSWSHRFLQLAWAFFSLVLLNTYTAGLAALFTVHELTQRLTSLDDLNRLATSIAIVPQDAAYQYLTGSVNPTMQAITSRLIPYPDVMSSVLAVQNGNVTAAMGEYFTMQYWARTIPCKLQIVGSPFGPGNLVFGLRKNSSYTAALNDAILQLRGNGVIDQLKRRWVDDLDQCNDDDLRYGGNALDIRTIAGLFYMLLLFIALSFVWVGAEHLAIWLNHRYPQHTAKIRALMAFFDRFKTKDKRFSVLRKFNSARWSGRRSSMLKSISFNRRRSSNASAGSDSDVPEPRSTRTTTDMRPSSARSTSDLKLPFLRSSWRRTADSVELTASASKGGALVVSDAAANAVPSPLDDVREAATREQQQQEHQHPQQVAAPPYTGQESSASEGGKPLPRKSLSERSLRPSPSAAVGVGEVTNDEVAAVIGSYGRQQ